MNSRKLFKSLIERSLFFSRIVAFFAYPFYKNKPWMINVLKVYSRDVQNYKIDNKCLKRDLFISKHHYKMRPDEYFMYHFPYLTDRGRKKFFGGIELMRLFKRLGSKETDLIFVNKYETYRHFKDYFQRNVLKLPSEGQSRFEEFVNANKLFVVKPLSESCGRGVYIIDLQKEDISVDDLYKKIIAHGDCIVEGYIKQVPEMAQFHPGSVNTMRVMTLVRSGNVHVIHAFLRFGRDGKEVDNGGQGGILASIDVETGIVDTKGITEDYQEFICHPNTGVQIIGFRVPEYESGIDLARKMAMVIPEQACIGWDMALTEKGWVLVEGNSRPGLIGPQLTRQKGVRDIVEKLFI